MIHRISAPSATPREPQGISHWQRFIGDGYRVSPRSLRALCEIKKIPAFYVSASPRLRVSHRDIASRCIHRSPLIDTRLSAPSVRSACSVRDKADPCCVSPRVFRISRHSSAMDICVLCVLCAPLCEPKKISAVRDPRQIALADIHRRWIYVCSACSAPLCASQRRSPLCETQGKSH